MPESDFAAWVEPLAREIKQSRAEVVAFARALPEAGWDEPSAVDGWSRRDVLAHLAGDTAKITVAVIRAAGDPRAPVPSYGEGDVALNARDLEERRGWSIEQLIAEIEADAEEWRRGLGGLGEDDGARSWPGFPLDAAGYLAMVAGHDREHLEQMR